VEGGAPVLQRKARRSAERPAAWLSGEPLTAMKLVTYSLQGQVALGALSNNRVVDLHRAHRAALSHAGDADELAVADLRVPANLSGLLRGGAVSMAAARRALTFVEEQRAMDHTAGLWHSVADVEVLAPIQRPAKVVCVGLNYRSHLAEIGDPIPEYPILFHKAATSIIGHGQAIVLPRISRQVDYEGELAVVIGRRGKYIPEDNALSYVAGYTCANDVSAHDIEFRTSQWTSGKMLDTFCPLGPVLLTGDEVPDPGSFCLKTVLNGQTMQEEWTSDMVFPVAFLISYISSLATLEPGDIILTGTPAGIGCNRKPQVFLQAGDRISVQIDGIGTLANPVVAEEGR
jgi:acylpyruvate hydrolase